MIGREIEASSGEDLVRLVRALGQHRYVAGRMHLVHAFAVEAACEGAVDGAALASLADARSWAANALSDPSIERDSRDERLYRRATDAELTAVLAAFWTPGDGRGRARAKLAERLGEIGVDPNAGLGADAGAEPRIPFDEDAEESVFPLLVDAGWELFPLAQLDPERHKGAMNAFDDAFAFEVAKFEEDNAVPAVATLHELPALGALELLHAFDEAGAPRAPFVIWASGNETYLDYVMRGVLKIAKLEGA